MEKLLTSLDLAQVLGVQPTTVNWWRWKGVGPRYVRVGRTIRYRPGDIEKFMKEREIDPAIPKDGKKGKRVKNGQQKALPETQKRCPGR